MDSQDRATWSVWLNMKCTLSTQKIGFQKSKRNSGLNTATLPVAVPKFVQPAFRSLMTPLFNSRNVLSTVITTRFNESGEPSHERR